MAQTRFFANVTAGTTVSVDPGTTPGTITLTVADTTPFASMTSFPYPILIEWGSTNQEVMSVTARPSSTTFTATRAQDGTSALAHAVGTQVYHGVSARDFNESNAHINASAGVHGATGSMVGTTDTQTLTNKTLASPVLTGVRSIQYAQKAADQNLTSSITMTNDSDLFVSLVANATYKVEIYGSCKSPANGLQTSWSVPAGTTGVKMCIGPTSIVADGQNRGDTRMRIQAATAFTTAITYSVDLTVQTVVQETGLISTAGTAGTFNWQWAQITSSATAATMFTGSYMIVERLA